MDFVLTGKINCFPTHFYLWSKSEYGHVSRKFLNFNDSKAFSYKHVPYKKACIVMKINFLMVRKIRPK